MSYCRYGADSDVYLYADAITGGWTCHGEHEPPGVADCKTLRAVLDHLTWHRSQGHKVPERVFERVLVELADLPVRS